MSEPPATAFDPYLSISASAGCGKTYTLAHRVLRLLAMGARPDSIGAYTFSRKAAGEIFDAIVEYLRKAAADPRAAERTSAAMGLSRSPEAFMGDLRALLSQLHRLRIGTLDSRIAQMLSAAAVELQLPPEFALLDGQGPEARFLHEQTLDGLLAPGVLSEESKEAFLGSFELTTQGLAENALDRKLLEMISDHRSVFLLFPEAEAWRHPGGGLEVREPPRALPEEDRSLLAAHLRESLGETALPELLKLIDSCEAYTPGKSWSKDRPTGALAERLLQAEIGEEILYRRKPVPLTEEQHRGLKLLLRHPSGVELERAWMQTRGVFGLLAAFEERYMRTAMARGAVSFEDACALITGFHHLPPGALAFRMDGEVAHWLLDEFQDTSTLQWRAVEPFVDEVLQDAGGERSFFYVGDVKQAIYAWRGGNADLFDRVRERYAEKIRMEPMDVSQRSAPAVLELVNRLMDAVPEMEGFPAGARAKWNAQFRPHTAAERHLNLPGTARVVERHDKEDEAELALLTELLRTLDPGLEVAVLVRSNRRGADLADGLRREGFSVVQEGQSALRNDTAVEAVLAALTLAAHPGDRFAGRVLEMAGWEPDPRELLRSVHEQGVARTLQSLVRSLPLEEDAAFSRDRLRKLVEAGQEFDRMDLPSIDRFLAFVDRTYLKEHEARGVIRIMTIHQSKGLGFDVVFLPLTASMSFVSVETHSLVTSAEGREPGWVLQLPQKEVCEQTGGLDAEFERLQAESAYENLCNLYVALTRAKQGLFVLLPPAPAKGGSLNVMHNWIRHRLEGGASGGAAGDPLEFGTTLAAYGDVSLPAPERSRPAVREPLPMRLAAGRAVLPRLEPSRADAESRDLGRTFHRIAVDGRALGSRVHAILEKLTWTDEISLEALLAASGEPGDSPAAGHVRRAYDFEALRMPKGVKNLWREQHFESVMPEGWITGIFDRVVIFEDGAWIQDYKTNLRSGSDTVAHYAPQMALYRGVLADMLGFAPEKIRCQLLFTHTGDVVEVI
ncbi:MAG: UvrD-helicase domain-containing protein [Verrucomicrobia bacterium]|nr:UvrD-helicase domain-containing protein [Verrucomicrobiota bacterium]MCH8527432.1 UvrD-helicase domain-containing protein [Kiritimatiellia bacterium]